MSTSSGSLDYGRFDELAEEPASPNVAALPGELAAYVSFILVRYHFL